MTSPAADSGFLCTTSPACAVSPAVMEIELNGTVAVIEPRLSRVGERVYCVCACVHMCKCVTLKKSIRASETWQLAAMRLTAPISSWQRVINTKTTPGRSRAASLDLSK